MSNRANRPFLLVLTSVVLALGTTALFYMASERSMSRPQPISGPIKSGYDFTVIAMNGNQPVELIHEWSAWVQREIEVANSLYGPKKKPSKADLRADVESSVKMPIVWADTGRATSPLRFYLTKDDLPGVNSLLDSGPEEYPHDVQVKILEDDPEHKSQILQVTVCADDTDFINVYQVKNERVLPLKWIGFRPRAMLPVLVMLPPVFAVAGFIWYLLLNKLILWRRAV